MALDLEKMTPQQLRTLIQNADQRGAAELSASAFKQLCKIQPGVETNDGLAADDPVRIEFWRAINAAEELRTRANGKTTRLSRTRQKAGREGIVATMEAMALKAAPSEGFRILIEGGHPEFVFEHIIARHPNRFSGSAVKAAHARLVDHGIRLA